MTYQDPEDYAEWMEAVADDAGALSKKGHNTNRMHPLGAFLQGVEFASRYAAFQARTIDIEDTDE